MSKITWDATGERFYENGVDHCVVYPQEANAYGEGVAWNGITGITMSPDGAEPTELYADNIKYAELRSAETLGLTIEAYTYPDVVANADGTAEPATGVRIGQQKRKAIGLCYRTNIGNDTMTEEDDGYKLHLVYGVVLSPSEKAYETENESPDAITFSWEATTNPVTVEGYKPIADIVIDSTKADKTKLKALEDKLYGTENASATLPMPSEVISMMKAA